MTNICSNDKNIHLFLFCKCLYWYVILSSGNHHIILHVILFSLIFLVIVQFFVYCVCTLIILFYIFCNSIFIISNNIIVLFSMIILFVTNKHKYVHMFKLMLQVQFLWHIITNNRSVHICRSIYVFCYFVH